MSEASRLNYVVDKCCKFFFEVYIDVSLSGHPLEDSKLKLAKSLGIRKPNLIRYKLVDSKEFHQKYNPANVLELAELQSLSLSLPGGLTSKYALVLDIKQTSDYDTWVRLLRLINYFECYGGIRKFLDLYLRYQQLFGWEKNPFRHDFEQSRLLGLSY